MGDPIYLLRATINIRTPSPLQIPDNFLNFGREFQFSLLITIQQ